MSVAERQADLDRWLVYYNTERPHQGYRNMGRRPMDTIAEFLALPDFRERCLTPARQETVSQVRVNGQARTMSANPVRVQGQRYVPLDVVEAALPGKFTYDAKARTVHYDPPQPKQPINTPGAKNALSIEQTLKNAVEVQIHGRYFFPANGSIRSTCDDKPKAVLNGHTNRNRKFQQYRPGRHCAERIQ